MKSISMVEENLPAGFRFHPRDEELICDYLMNKLSDHSHNHNHKHYSTLLIQVDLNKSEPWELPESACVGGKEWYFYSQRDRKYATGLRTNRATSCGYWKATGKDRPVLSSKSKSKYIVGMRKTLVFYQGRAPKGTKTDWVMHEFRLEQPLPLKDKNKNKNKSKEQDDQEDWVLCRVFYKSREMGSNNINISPTSSCSFSFNSLPLPALQVPCFSNLPPIPNQHVDLFFQPTTPTPTPIPMAHHAHTADTDTDNDNEVLKALLLNHMENDPNLECLGDPTSTSQTYLSQFHMLNHY